MVSNRSPEQERELDRLEVFLEQADQYGPPGKDNICVPLYIAWMEYQALSDSYGLAYLNCMAAQIEV